jgi:hypothetical protein
MHYTWNNNIETFARRQWRDLDEEQLKYLIQVQPPGDLIPEAIRTIVIAQNMSSAGILFDDSFGTHPLVLSKNLWLSAEFSYFSIFWSPKYHFFQPFKPKLLKNRSQTPLFFTVL